MGGLTKKQQAVLDFIAAELREGRPCPSHREIARAFGFASSRAAACHVEALVRKGHLTHSPGKARSLQLNGLARRNAVVNIPILGGIPAGPAADREQESRGCVSVDIASVGIKSSARTFALEVRGDSMVGRHILDGDMAVLEHGMTPRHGDVVAALIDNESTLKTFVQERGKPPHLKAENPKYPRLVPAQELVIQGVMVALIRKLRT